MDEVTIKKDARAPGRWVAEIQIKKRCLNLGSFESFDWAMKTASEAMKMLGDLPGDDK